MLPFALKRASTAEAAAVIIGLVVLTASPSVCQVFPSDSAGGISCFQCQSVNQSNPACEDPFNSTDLPLSNLCSEGRKGQKGLFPGRYCFKIKGIRATDGVEVLVRRCSVDTLVDNALKSHYGHFKIISDGQPQQFFGTVSMCRYDGCNEGSKVPLGNRQLHLLLLVLLLPLLLTAYN